MIGFALLLMLQADPGRLQFEEANRLAEQGHCEQAEPIYIELSKEYPDKAAIPFALGQCQFRDKNYVAAAESFQRTLNIDPATTMAASMRGAALGMDGKTAEAVEQLRSATKQDPKFAPAFRMLGMFEAENGNTGPEAREVLEKAVSLDPADGRAHYWLGEVLLAEKAYEAALKEFAAALHIEPQSPQAVMGKASALRENGQVEAALAEFATVLRQNPNSAKALLGTAQCQYDLQNFRAATESAEAARKGTMDIADRRTALWLLARLYRVQDEPQEARRAESELTGMERETNEKLARFRSLQQRAAQYRAAGDFVKVAETLEEALKIEERQDSLVVLGDAYRKLGRPKDAIACYLRALETGPEQVEIRQRLEETQAALAQSTR